MKRETWFQQAIPNWNDCVSDRMDRDEGLIAGRLFRHQSVFDVDSLGQMCRSARTQRIQYGTSPATKKARFVSFMMEESFTRAHFVRIGSGQVESGVLTRGKL